MPSASRDWITRRARQKGGDEMPSTQDRNDLIAKARARAEAGPNPTEWGYRVQLDVAESFVGRWRGETVDADNDGRRIFLLWDADDGPCYSRSYAALAREVDRVMPTVGCTVAVFRGPDYIGAQGTGYAFGVQTEVNDDPLPAAGDGDDIPF